MSFFISYLLLSFYLLTLFNIGHGVKNTSTIIAELRERSDKRVSPNDNTGAPVTVNVSMYVSNLHEIDETKMEFGMDTYIRKSWNDPRLAFTDGPEIIHFGYDVAKDFIWMPDLYLYQSMGTEITESYKRDAGVRIKPNGDILVSVRMSIKLECNMDLRNFPFDKQTCDFRVSTYISTAKDVTLRWKSISKSGKGKAVGVTKIKHPPGFTLTDYNTAYDQVTYSDIFDVLSIKFYFDRIRTHYIVLTYIPSFLLVLVSGLLFWLPLTAVKERFLFGSILILALTQVLTHSQDQAPQVGYLKAIDTWVASCYFFICVALAEVVLLYLFAEKTSVFKDDHIELVNNDQLSNEDRPTAEKARGFLQGTLLEKVDLVLKYLYPAAFLLFNIVYWSVFA